MNRFRFLVITVHSPFYVAWMEMCLLGGCVALSLQLDSVSQNMHGIEQENLLEQPRDAVHMNK